MPASRGQQLSAGVVVAVLLMGCQPGSSGTPSAPGTSSAPTPSPEATSSRPEELPTSGRLAPGVWPIHDLDSTGINLTLTVPEGWYGLKYEAHTGVLWNNRFEPPDGAAVTFVTGDMNVYGDPCAWRGTEADPPTGPSVEEFVAAMAAQPMRNPSAITDITVGGYTGQAIEVSVPEDIQIIFDCDDSEFRSWVFDGGQYARYAQGRGQHDLLWVLDVAGTRVVIDTFFYPGTPPDAMREIEAILASIEFQPE